MGMKMSDYIDRIYDSFPIENRNMSRAEFKKAIKDLSDPIKMQQDLANIELLKARERTNKIRIDRSLKRRK